MHKQVHEGRPQRVRFPSYHWYFFPLVIKKKIYILLRAKLTFSFFLFIAVAIQHKTILTQQFSLPEGDLKLEIFKHVSNHF